MVSSSTGNKISVGGGNNTVYGEGRDQTVIAGDDNNKITVGSGHLEVGNGKNNILMTESGESKIYAGSGDDTINVTKRDEMAEQKYQNYIDAGDGNYNVISVGNGRNTIFTHHYYDTNYNQYNTIEAGTGSDLIYTSGKSGFINAGSGRNLISLAGGQYNTLITGKGNDTITLAADANNNKIIFGGGNDIVHNFHAGDTVLSVGALTQRTVGTNVILTDGKSNMTLKGAKDKTINTATLSSNDAIYKILVADKAVGDTVLPITIIPNPKTTPADIFNSTASKLITGTAYDDTLKNISSKVTINAQGGNDTITAQSMAAQGLIPSTIMA